MRVTVNDDGTWSYEEDAVLQIPDRGEPFHHIDRNTLTARRGTDAQPIGTQSTVGRARAKRRPGQSAACATERGNLL